MEASEYKRLWNLWCDKYDPDFLELKHIKEIVNLKDKTVLDVGCGNGRLTFQLAKESKKVIGIDTDSHLIDEAKENSLVNTEFFSMDAELMDFEGNSFDVVIFSWCLTPNPVKSYQEAKRVLKDNGRFIFVYQDSKSEYEDVIGKFLSEDYPKTDIDKDLIEPIKKVFSDIKIKRNVDIPYEFENSEQFFEVFRFALEEWHKTKLDDENKLRKEISKYKDNIIHEEVLFIWTS